MIGGSLPILLESLRGQRCCHPTGYHRALIGKDEHGNFRTRPSMEYPPRLCETMARHYIDALSTQLPKPGHRRPVPPIAEELTNPKTWRLVLKSRWKFEEHQNVLELRTLVLLARRLSRSSRSWDRRFLCFTDSLVSLGALGKGRSSSPALLGLCRRFAAIRAACGVRILLRWVPSGWNVADGPSRGAGVGDHPADGDEKTAPRPHAYLGQG